MRPMETLTSDLVAIVRRHDPAWTGSNDSDPGVTLLEVAAWLAERFDAVRGISSWQTVLGTVARRDPYSDFRFRVKWDGNVVAHVTRISALRRAVEIVEYRDGATPDVVQRLPGRHTCEPFTLERPAGCGYLVRGLGRPGPSADARHRASEERPDGNPGPGGEPVPGIRRDRLLARGISDPADTHRAAYPSAGGVAARPERATGRLRHRGVPSFGETPTAAATRWRGPRPATLRCCRRSPSRPERSRRPYWACFRGPAARSWCHSSRRSRKSRRWPRG